MCSILSSTYSRITDDLIFSGMFHSKIIEENFRQREVLWCRSALTPYSNPKNLRPILLVAKIPQPEAICA
jgi:hypothetical protein